MPIKNIQHKAIPLLTVMLAALATLSPLAIDTYLAAMPIMSDVFGVHISVVELTITLYFLGFALGNFFGGPLSDSFGRRRIALFGIALYGLSALGISFCKEIEYILVLRVFQAFGGGFATVTANVFIRDWYEGKQVAKMVTIVSLMMMLAPLFAPVIGSLLIDFKGWQAVFHFLFIFAVVLFSAFFIIVPESRSKELITKKVTRNQILDKYREFFSDRLSVILLFAISFSMSGLYIFLTSSSFIYIEYFGIDRSLFPYLFGANILLNILLSFLNTFLLKRYRPRYILRAGLLLELIAGIIILVSVSQAEPELWWVFSGIVLFIGSLGLVFGNGTAVILNINPKVSSSANATIGISRFLLSFIIGSVISLFKAENLIPIGSAMFACALIANILYAKALREANK
ncbi:multidrug effflux MFS transporter [Saccharicrinis aurantiacus]|uniref:multidrug effflux MFS transporter n=1 Tax=Saccharicrinis aurantiacus TaxID=1849719 RepID=UPI00094FD92C|nr:multidrug effflux MFS transporter [Saccharicrinis aurantiacus]